MDLSELPTIEFLDVYFYEYRQNNYAILAEKRLDKNKFQKWNDNKGGIHNIQ